jgi:hypothetical protein
MPVREQYPDASILLDHTSVSGSTGIFRVANMLVSVRDSFDKP